MLIEIREKPFNAYEEISDYLNTLHIKGQYGATASFIGSMRDVNEDKTITGMTLEHYPEMTEKQLTKIVKQAIDKWRLLDVLILHRIGKIEIGEDIVLAATWAAHRKEAFESCRHIMEELKSTAPFWKKEETTSGNRWVENNTAGF